MYNLFIFIKKYNAVILFILLEILCFILVMQSLPYHSRKMVNVSNSVSGSFYKTTSNWKNYIALKSENELLAEQNALLMSRLGNDLLANDTVMSDELFTFIPAHVISNSINERNNFLVIDKGRLDGLEPDMGVISSNGVVGKIVNVSNHYASVMSLLNSYAVISCRFIDNQYVANAVWNGKDYRYGIIKDIPSHLVINIGDTLVTSGFSNSFPADIMVGTIEDNDVSDNNMFNTAKIRFSTNFNSLRHVFVVKNNYKTEIDSLCITY